MSTPCPTCNFAVPDGREKCPQCGRVFGEANRCPHCHAIASVRSSGKGFVCSACGKSRELLPGTTLAGATPTSTGLTTPRRRGLRLLAALSFAAAIFGAASATTLLGATGIGIAMAIVVGSVFAYGGVQLLKRATDEESTLDRQLAVNRTEKARQILLERTSTVPELAAKLGTSEAEADAIASKLAAQETDGIHAELDETEGVVRFGRKSVLPPVRIADPDEGEDDVEAKREKREKRL
ncbi:MAG: hypothetical protein J0L92_12495 [Deltaproteobacteria bacterium]|nr:hypothetical protein [Deltaproteobacteria bacterium]